MKKKYIQYRSGLLIGLLSLNTLSSCVSTRHGLGMSGWGSKKSNNNSVEDGGNSSQRGGKYEKVKDAAWSTAKTVGAGALGYGARMAQEYFSGGAGSNRSGSHSTGYNNTGSSSNAWGTFDPSRR